MSYAIEVHRVEARLRTVGGEDLESTLFVHPVGHADYRPETVGDRLNQPSELFLPCEIDGQSQLVRLASIAFVELPEPPPEVEALESVGAIRAPVELYLRSKDTLRGSLMFEADRGHARVSDVLNKHSERFVLLLDDRRAYFVQRDAIDRVKP